MATVLASAVGDLPTTRPGGSISAPADKYQALLSACGEAVVILDAAGLIVEASRTVERLWGWPVADLVGRPLPELARGDGASALSMAIAQAVIEGRAGCRAVVFLRGDGVEASAECSLARIAGSGELVAVLRDVSERVRLEQQAHRNGRLATIGTLAAGVAHEINNPTAYVLANLSQLRNCTDAVRSVAFELSGDGAPGRRPREELAGEFSRLMGELDELVTETVQGGERVRGIVRDLRTFSRMDDDDAAAPLRVHEALDAAVRVAGSELRHRTSVRRAYQADLPEIVVSPGRLHQVFLNLILNGAQAMDRGGPAENVLTLSTYREGDGVAIEVSDTGPGIPPDVIPRIFEPFFTTKAPGQGTGLGLAISRDIVRRQGGQIRVRSERGKGTTFAVWLPLRAPSVGPLRPEPPPAAAKRSTNGGLARVSGERRARILVVDDEPHLLKAFQRMLGKRHELVIAQGGRAAMELLAAGLECDVVLSDLVMPDLDGVALYELVAKHRPGLERRMIFVTGGAFTERTSLFLERIANPRLEKPVIPEELLAAIDQLLGLFPVPVPVS